MYIRLHYNVEVILHYAVLHYIMYEIQHSYNIIFYWWIKFVNLHLLFLL